jgi:hypothetical protein
MPFPPRSQRPTFLAKSLGEFTRCYGSPLLLVEAPAQLLLLNRDLSLLVAFRCSVAILRRMQSGDQWRGSHCVHSRLARGSQQLGYVRWRSGDLNHRRDVFGRAFKVVAIKRLSVRLPLFSHESGVVEASLWGVISWIRVMPTTLQHRLVLSKSAPLARIYVCPQLDSRSSFFRDRRNFEVF